MRRTIPAKPSTALILAAVNLLAARAKVQLLKPKVEALQNIVLAENAFYISPEWLEEGQTPPRITNFSDLYESPQETWPEQTRLLHEAYTAAGYVVEYGCCPLLIAQREEVEARWHFTDLTQEINPVFDVAQVLHGTETGDKYVELSLSYVAQFIKLRK